MFRTQTGLFDSMRSILVLTTLAAITALSSAAAQSYSDSVTVNSGGTRVLIDPGTGQTRVVPPLLMPGDGQETIRLRPPGHHRRVRTATHSAASPAVAAVPRRTASTASVQQGAASSGLSDLTDLARQAPTAPPPPRRTPPRVLPPKRAALIETPPPAKPAVQVRTASIETPKPVRSRSEGGKARGVITFAANASEPTTTAVATVRSLADDLNSALTNGATRVEVRAYAGERGEKSSDTRRLSLKRALVIRQLLIDDGVPSERIDVFALGGVEDDGPTDRVDIFLKS
jgi:outer membrane protein OmpA-like peptidoglycan-associated protein